MSQYFIDDVNDTINNKIANFRNVLVLHLF